MTRADEDILERISPWKGNTTYHGKMANSSEITEKVLFVKNGQRRWAQSSLESRCEVAKNYAQQLQKHEAELAVLISEEVGKTRKEANAEIRTAIAKIQTSIDAVTQRRMPIRQGELRLGYRPLGLMVVLGPFNFPLHLPGSHMVPALLAGNGVVFKPSELAPAVGTKLVELWHRAGLPENVLQKVDGGACVATSLIDHPSIDGVLFTGSLKAGLAIHRQLAGRPNVLLALEMGGNNPLIVLDLKDVTFAVEVAIASAFITSGQRCTCARRIIVVENESTQPFIEAFVETAKSKPVGLPSDEPEPFIGPLITSLAVQQALEFQQTWLKRGGSPLLLAQASGRCSALMSPGILDVTDVADMQDEECFAPLVLIKRVKTFEDAIAVANQTKFGLSAGLIGGDARDFAKFKSEVAAGVLCWNQPTTGASGRLPFGGLGFSGNHRASAFFACDYCDDPIAIVGEP